MMLLFTLMLVKHASDYDAIIYTDGAVLQRKSSGWLFTAKVQGGPVSRAVRLMWLHPKCGLNCRQQLLHSDNSQVLIKSVTIISASRSIILKVNIGLVWYA